MTRSVVVVPDTNIFLHCKPLHELPWSTLASDEVNLVLVDPVISELDQWKDRGEDRRAKRVRALLPQIRLLLASGDASVEITPGPPIVRLSLDVVDSAALSVQDTDAWILDTAQNLAGRSKLPVLLLTRDVLMALRSRRRLIETRLLTPEDTDWNARPERPDPQIRELQRELSELQSQCPQLGASLEMFGGTVRGDRLIVLQPKITDFDQYEPITDWAHKYFEEHSPRSSTEKRWNFDDASWRGKLYDLDHNAIVELARRASGGIAVLHVRNTGSVNANDVRIELIAEGGWLLASKIPRLRFDVPKPSIYERPDPYAVRVPEIPNYNFRTPQPIDPSEPVWDVAESENSEVSQLIARVPLLRHRDAATIEFKIGLPRDMESPGKLIVRITAAKNPKPTTTTYVVERESHEVSMTGFIALLSERGELQIQQRNK